MALENFDFGGENDSELNKSSLREDRLIELEASSRAVSFICSHSLPNYLNKLSSERLRTLERNEELLLEVLDLPGEEYAPEMAQTHLLRIEQILSPKNFVPRENYRA